MLLSLTRADPVSRVDSRPCDSTLTAYTFCKITSFFLVAYCSFRAAVPSPRREMMTLMHLPSLIPDWNSLDVVRRVHSDLELGSIISFALLAFFDVLAHRTDDVKREKTFGSIGLWFFGIAVLCEAMAYVYGRRNDSLSEGVIRSLSSTATQAATDSQNALKDSGTAITQARQAKTSAAGAIGEAGEAAAKIDALDRKAADLETWEGEIAHRLVLTGSRFALLNDSRAIFKFEKALKPFAGQKAFILYTSNDPASGTERETFALAETLNWRLQGAGWRVPPSKAMGPAGEGVVVTRSPKASALTIKAADALAGALFDVPLALPTPRNQSSSKGVEIAEPAFEGQDDETITVVVGVHP